MKSPSIPKRFNSNSRLLLGFLGVLLGGCVLLAGLSAISKTFAARIGSPHAVPSTSFALSSKDYVASLPGTAHRLDEQGNRLRGISFLPWPPRNTRAIRPTGNGNWFSLGPPGGDVFAMEVHKRAIWPAHLIERLKNLSLAGRRFLMLHFHGRASTRLLLKRIHLARSEYFNAFLMAGSIE